MDKSILLQYADLQKEKKEVQEKIAKLKEQIPKLEKRISEIEEGEIVQDKVYGGAGGTQGFVIRGIPTKEYIDKKMEFNIKKQLLENRLDVLNTLELESARQIVEIERFISNINDCHIRRIVNLRVVESLSWIEVAEKIGGGNTDAGVRKAFQRYFEEN